MGGRLPSKHRFPGGFTIEIEFADQVGEDVNTDGIGMLGPGDYGRYDTTAADKGLITLWTQATPNQKWTALMHELLHALADAQNWVELRK